MENTGPESLLQLKTTVCCVALWDREEPVYNQHWVGKHLYYLAQSFSLMLDRWKKEKSQRMVLSGRCSLMASTLLCFWCLDVRDC